jgi:hypothetical protein
MMNMIFKLDGYTPKSQQERLDHPAGTDDISAQVKESFDFRIDERRNIELVHLMKYFVNPDYLSLLEDQFGHKIRRPKIANLAINFHSKKSTGKVG